jgi:Fur family ferric uptake transcriptional regulator
MVQPALNARKHLVYQIAQREHHHLICTSCSKSLEVEHYTVQSLYRQLETRSGYRLAAGHLTLFGLCPACQKPSR